MSTKSLNDSDPNDLGGHEKNLNLKALDAAEVEDIAVQDGVSAIYEAKCRLSTSLPSLLRLLFSSPSPSLFLHSIGSSTFASKPGLSPCGE